ncbi:hypothetical protein GCM10017771_61310 [Streptomyces capitiformicae]|uniref:Transposase n=1 Tax=Streptomyces capitiformicae TaxID=2014920 RepID=A0A918ZBD1_9ACTN|nr:hypothetical protein GCM10017771_61310 [Streptomyces capitiformicae]
MSSVRLTICRVRAGLRAQTTLERRHQVHDLLEKGNTVRRYARATASYLVSVTLRHRHM